MIENALQIVRAAAEPAPSTGVIVSKDKFLVFGIPEQLRDAQDLIVKVYDRHGYRRDTSDFHAISNINGVWYWYTREYNNFKHFLDGQVVHVAGQPVIGKVVYVPKHGHMKDFATEMFTRRSEMPGAVVFDGYVHVGLKCGAFDSTMSMLIQEASKYAPHLAHYGLSTTYKKDDMRVYLSTLNGQPVVSAKNVPALAQKAAETSARLMEGVNAFVDFANKFSESFAYQAFKLVQE